jgi:L-cysteine desulfidase
MRISTPTEHLEQVTLIAWYRRTYKNELLVAIPNGGKRHIKTALAMKREGVSKGFPDIFLPVPNSQFHGLFIEMKRKKGGALSKEQKAWLEHLNSVGYQAVVCKGFLEAKEVIECYLSDTTNMTKNG